MSLCKALRKDCWGVQAALRHPLLEGKKLIGRGVFSMVFEGTRKNTVLKMTVDNIGYYAFNDWVVGCRHRHFPRVVHSEGDIGSAKINGRDYSIYLFEMERLQPLAAGSEARRLARRIMNVSATASGKYHWKTGDDIRAMLTFGEMVRDSSLPRSVRNAVQQLEEFCGNVPGGSVDLHMHNMMMRKNGDLVIIDPVANMKIWRESMEQLKRRGY
jgi:hypothetical protein